MSAFLAVLGTVLLFLGKLLLILVLLVLAVGVFLLLCPFCADVCWEGETLTVRAGAMGLTFPVFQYPKPEPAAPQTPPTGWRGKLKARFAAWRAKRKERAAKKTAPAKPKEPTPPKQKAKLTLQVVCTLARGCGRIMGAVLGALRFAAKKTAPAKPKEPTPPKQKAKLTLQVVCTLARGCGRIMGAVLGALRFTKIDVCLGVRGEDPAEAARSYGRLNAWLYPVLGVLDRTFYLQFDRFRILPDFGGPEPSVQDHVSFRVSAQALFIVITTVQVLMEMWREKVLDVFL